MDKAMVPALDEDGLPFPEYDRRIAEKFAPLASTPRLVEAQATRAIEDALRRPPAPEPATEGSPARHSLLAEREHTHGNFEATALISQRFKGVARSTPNWSKLDDVQREALEGVFVKIARILSGNPNHKDHWSDIGGGAGLVEEHLS